MKKSILFILLFFLFSYAIEAFSQRVVKILAIGNSFSQDAIEQNLYELAKADDVELIIGNLYIGGCDLHTHWNNANANNSAYSYRKIVNGVKTTLGSKSIQDGVRDENWDFISFQQVSQNSGIYTTYYPYLPNLLNYVKGLATNQNVQYCLHRTWAYAANSTHSGFLNYRSDQKIMFDSIVSTTSRVAAENGISTIIPAGTAIQNGRTSFVGDNFNSDGYHLNSIGRYTASCTWYEKLLGNAVIGNSYSPSDLSPTEVKIAQQAAHSAVISSENITTVVVVEPPAVETTNLIYIDFSDPNQLSQGVWNNLTNPVSGSMQLIDDQGIKTLCRIEVTDPFYFTPNNAGTTAATSGEASIFPTSVTMDSFYALSENPVGEFQITGLNPNVYYSFSIFASRGGVSDNREALYTITGADGAKTATLDAANNTSQVAIISNNLPTSTGILTLKVEAGSNNTNNMKYFYIGGLKMSRSDNGTGVKNTNISKTTNVYYQDGCLRTVNCKGEIKIYNLAGKTIAEGTVISDKFKVHLKEGTYIVNTINGNAKLVIQ